MIEKIINALKNASFWTDNTYDEDGYSNDDSVEVIALDEAIEIVQEVAKEYGNGWIPCSERLPSDCAIHEVTAKFRNGKRYTEFAYYDESREEWWKFDDDGTVNVIAWKEGSAPYKKGE